MCQRVHDDEPWTWCRFTGARGKFSDCQLRGAMKLAKEAGLILAFTSKDIYCKDKLQENLERLRCRAGIARDDSVGSGPPLQNHQG